MRLRVIAGVVCAGALVWAAPAQATTAHSAVIGGSPVSTAAYPYVGFLNAPPSRGPLADLKTMRCTLVLVAPDVALTAGHCVVSSHGGFLIPPRKLEVVFLKDQIAGRVAGERARVTQVSVRAEYGETMVADIAVLRLDRALPITPATLPGPDQVGLGTAGTPMEFIGWGIWNRRAGRKKSRRNRVLRSGPGLVEECRLRAFLAKGVGPGVVCASGAPYQACHGDSGGPALARTADGRTFVIGTASITGAFCTTRGSTVYTGLLPQSPYAAWVKERIAAPDYEAPAISVDPPLARAAGRGPAIRVSANEPVHAACRFNRGRWFLCVRGTEATLTPSARKLGRRNVLRVSAYDESGNRTFFRFAFRAGRR